MTLKGPAIPWDEVKTPPKPKADGERFPERRQPEYVRWFDAQKFPCVVVEVCGSTDLSGNKIGNCFGPLEDMHLRSRGAGGEDIGNLVKGCHGHHQRLHRIGQRQFEYELGAKLRPFARAAESKFYAERKHGK